VWRQERWKGTQNTINHNVVPSREKQKPRSHVQHMYGGTRRGEILEERKTLTPGEKMKGSGNLPWEHFWGGGLGGGLRGVPVKVLYFHAWGSRKSQREGRLGVYPPWLKPEENRLPQRGSRKVSIITIHGKKGTR